MHHRNRNIESIRRAGLCAGLAALMTIGLFSLVAALMSYAVDRSQPAADDGIRVIEVTVVKGKREAVPVARADGRGWMGQRPEAI